MEIMEFESMEDAARFMQEQTDLANARTLPFQRAISYGDHWMRVTDLYGHNVFIFGRVLSRKDNLEGNVSKEIAEQLGEDYTIEDVLTACKQADYELEDLQEVEGMFSSFEANYERGYRFSRCYSMIEPRGELGDTHCAEIVPITQQEFEEAQKQGFDPAVLIENTRWFLVRIAEHVFALSNQQS